MSRGKLIRATSPDTGSMLATMSVSVNVVCRFSAASIPVSRMLIRASGVSGVATGGTTPNGPVGLGAEPFGVTTSGAPGEKTRSAPRYSDHETDAAQRGVHPTQSATRDNG